jgi:hypothetical protein
MPAPTAPNKWKWGAVVSLVMVLLSLVPQLHLWVVLGSDWNGAYVSAQGDEPLYSAYINALMDGRTRKNDPFGGRDDSPNAPLPESTFSIQFVPAYLISFAASAAGATASTGFIILVALAALFASLAVFSLLHAVIKDPLVAAAGTLFVLCLGCIVGRYGFFGTFLDIGVPALPFLRRYQPAAAFPLFFLFQLCVWRALTSPGKRAAHTAAALAGVTVSLLVFSYLYLWTGAAAWLACVGALWLFLRKEERRKMLQVLSIITGITAFALVPYAYLLSQRPATLDQHQTLISTHRPDLFRAHEILGVAIIIAVVLGVRRHLIQKSDPLAIYALSLALLPIVVFNQQVLTGKMMQAFHYEIFVVNYSTLIGLVITLAIFFTPVSRRLLVWTAALSLAWGFVVVALPAQLAFVPGAIANDQNIPVLKRLKELSSQDGTALDLRTKGYTSTLVYSPRLALIELLPTWTSQGTLIDAGGVDFGSITREERKQFFYMHLYYSQADTEDLRKVLTGQEHNLTMSRYARSLIFGHERITPALSLNFTPITAAEVDQEVRVYQAYANSFSAAEVLKRPIAYAVVPAHDHFDFANLDRWYQRDSGETVGANILYRLKVRN